MKVCPECYSDNVERTSSTGIRVVICIVLLFIPFGIFICWVPFVFSHTFECNLCGKEEKEEKLIGMDWREKEVLLEKQRSIEESLKLMIGKWFKFDGYLYKIVKGKGHLLLLEVSEGNIAPLLIEDFSSNTIKAKNKISNNLIVLTTKVIDKDIDGTRHEPAKYDSIADSYHILTETETILTSFGKELIMKEEFTHFKNGIDDLLQFLESKEVLLDNLKVIVN